jgi:hypothetical protein
MKSELWDVPAEWPGHVSLSVQYPDGSYAPVPVPVGVPGRDFTAWIEALEDHHRVTGVTVRDAEGVARSVTR